MARVLFSFFGSEHRPPPSHYEINRPPQKGSGRLYVFQPLARSILLWLLFFDLYYNRLVDESGPAKYYEPLTSIAMPIHFSPSTSMSISMSKTYRHQLRYPHRNPHKKKIYMNGWRLLISATNNMLLRMGKVDIFQSSHSTNCGACAT